MKLTDNLHGMPLDDANTVYHSLILSIFSILYQDKYHNEGDTQHYLLESIKCSLYSPDVNFNCIKNIDFTVDNHQMKAMAAKFLDSME